MVLSVLMVPGGQAGQISMGRCGPAGDCLEVALVSGGDTSRAQATSERAPLLENTRIF